MQTSEVELLKSRMERTRPYEKLGVRETALANIVRFVAKRKT
jgi:hypothetical protein